MSRLSKFSENAELQASYRLWLNSPLTQEVLAVLQERFLRPVLPGALGQIVDAQSAAFCLGENAGAWKIFDAIRSLDTMEVVETKEPAATYTAPKED